MSKEQLKPVLYGRVQPLAPLQPTYSTSILRTPPRSFFEATVAMGV